jgi:hypothetical protein
LTKTVLETALEAEMSEHLGYDRHDPVGRDGGNSRDVPVPAFIVDGLAQLMAGRPSDALVFPAPRGGVGFGVVRQLFDPRSAGSCSARGST